MTAHWAVYGIGCALIVAAIFTPGILAWLVWTLGIVLGIIGAVWGRRRR